MSDGVGSDYYADENEGVQKTAMLLFARHFWSGSRGAADPFAVHDGDDWLLHGPDVAYERTSTDLAEHAPVNLTQEQVEQALRDVAFHDGRVHHQFDDFAGGDKDAYRKLARTLLTVEAAGD